MERKAEVQVRFNIAFEYDDASRRGLSFEGSFAGTVAHEGAHVLDEQFLGRNPRGFMERFFTEQNAYTVQSQVERSLGIMSNGLVVWNPSWLKAGDSEKLRREAVKDAATRTAR